MNFRDQIRDWLGGIWSDFWQVPLGAVLIAVVAVLWAIVELVWRTQGALNPAINLSYHAQWPLRILMGLVVLRLVRMLARSR